MGVDIRNELTQVLKYCDKRVFFIRADVPDPRIGFPIMARHATKFVLAGDGNHPDKNLMEIEDTATGYKTQCRRKFAYGPLYGPEIYDDVLIRTKIRCMPWSLESGEGLESLGDEILRKGETWEQECLTAKGQGKGIKPQADDPEFSLRAGGQGQLSQKIKRDDIVHIRRSYDSREEKGPSQSGFLGVRTGAGLSDEAQSLVDK